MEIPLSAVTMHPKGTPAPASSVKAQVFEERVDLSNDMTGWQMIAVGVRRLVLARGELDRLEGPGYAARRAELRRKAQEAVRTRDLAFPRVSSRTLPGFLSVFPARFPTTPSSFLGKPRGNSVEFVILGGL